MTNTGLLNLAKRRGPWVVQCSSHSGEFHSLTQVAERTDIGIDILEGISMLDKMGTLNVLRVNLVFPEYFGMNWDALEECISEFERPKQAVHLIMITNAQELLIESKPEDLAVMIDIFQAVGTREYGSYAKDDPIRTGGTACKLLLCTIHGEALRLRNRLTAVNKVVGLVEV